MAESLGEKLRLAREARGITISEVSAQTRIATRYLEAIEENNYKPLPGGVFNKGFIKAYAKYVGVDETEALNDYARIMASQSEPEEEETRYRRPSVMTDDSRRSSWTSLIFAVIILVLMTGGILALVQWYRNEPTEPAKNPPANNANNAVANTNTASNSTTAPAAVDNLKIELRSVAQTGTSVTTWVDEKKEFATVLPSAPMTYEPQTSFRIAYSRSHAENVQLVLNGKTIQLPLKPFPLNDSNIRFEISKANAAQIMQAGQITLGEPTPTPTPADANTAANANMAVAEPATTLRPAGAATPPRPTPKPATTPAPGATNSATATNSAATPARATPARPTPAPTIIRPASTPDRD